MTEELELPEVDTNKLAPIQQIELDIARMREFLKLKIIDSNDKKGFEAVSKARKEVKAKRVDVENLRKGLVEDSVKWQKTVNTTAKTIKDKLEAIEHPLQKMEDDFQLALVHKKQEEARQAREKIEKRALVITSLDARFNGSEYTLGSISLGQLALERMTDEEFQTKVEAFESEYQIILEARQEKERLEKIEADRIEEQRKEQELAALELKRQQDELEEARRKLEEEKNAHEAEIKRIQDEKNAEAKRISDEKFAKEQEEKRLKELELAKEEARKDALIQAEKKAKEEAKAKIESDRIAADKEAKRLAKRPDIQKYKEMVNQIAAIVNAQEFSTQEGKAAKEEFKAGINQLVKSSPLKEV